ncbi:MAG: isochorismatase family protein [Fimbriimonadaceae bacterium]|nr:isochorismatase family protein [Fimbriimonadaceae bacterium]
MPTGIASREESLLLLVDLQPSFLGGIVESESVLKRCEFLARVAHELHVPILATEQYPERMGGTDDRFITLLSEPPYAKMAFSCLGCESVLEYIRKHEKEQIVLVGIETHICVTQTALPLLEFGYEVFVCEDAVSSRSDDRHNIGINRIRDAGAQVAHTESIAYEWMGSAGHPNFREVLKLVKDFA